ncbi:hypothetical protein SK128_026904 [Halocaridina rubra]|uniref:Uncharacterized protein n=1 Tax=Halocaridina rubra TaxID=373956 RepID=A0AAN9A3D8_HALRR
MSESSTTPTTPAGEPSDTHEAPESHPVEIQEEPSKENHPESEQVSADSSMQVSADSSIQVSADSSMHTEEEEEAHQTINNTPIEASTAEESSNSSDNTQDNAESAAGTSQMETSQTSGTSENDQTTPENTSEYPPTTPDTADNVLQGYVMVPILTPYYDPSVLYGYPVVVSDQNQQQHQRSYSKRKKKKYQRRRHADAAAGGYLDPQLYTGEPFVATPGGYVVPVDATTSVCQVHGFQYVSAPYQLHPQPSEEGFIQHPSYLSNIVQDPATQHVLLLGGTNQEDASKALQVFGDLQEKERRQIQEILHEQRARVGKSDSTESSDSGVSESEEAVTTELSCDEQDSQKSNTEESSASDNTEAAKDSITDQCLEAIPGLSSTDEIEPLQSLSQGSVVGDDTSTSNNSVQPQEENLLISHCKEPAEDISNQTDTASASCNSNDNDPDYVAHIADGTSIYPDKEASHSCNLLHPKTDLDADEECTDSLLEDISPAESVLTCDTDTKHIQKISKTDIALATVIAKDHSSGQIDLENRLIAQTETKHKDDADGIQNITKLCEEQGNIQENVFQSEPTTVTHTFPDDLSSQAPHTPHCSATTDKIVPEAFVYQSINELSSEERTSECLHQDSLQDLKVTEAVKRWIREVTPEKAFFLSEEVQTRILEQSIQEEMDSEDEYIEDEIPQSARSTVENPKNVEGNPFVAASSNAPFAGMESCNKRVAASNRQRGNTPDTLDEYDGSSTISNLSSDHLYSEASSSQPASFNQSFEEDYNEKYNENPNMYNPAVYAKYYQLGVEVDETTPSVTPVPQSWQLSRETTPAIQTESETVSECGSEDVETVPHKYDVVCQYTATSPMSLATEILKAEKVLSNMSHITGTHEGAEASGYSYGNPDIYLKHYGTARFIEVGDSGVQSEESSDEMEARSNVGSSGVGSSLASTPAVSPAHRFPGSTPLQSHPLRNLSVGDGPVPCRTVCCAVM